VEVPTSHPIHENFRVLTFRQTLAARGTCRRSQLEVLGELMLQSHASYSNCGLGSQGTDRLVDLVMEEKDRAVEMGMEPALFGAKITGGGCGGTVCVIGKADDEGEAAIQRVVQRYAEETGHVAQVFAGSSGGVVKFGVLRLSRQTI
jgi:galactokinase